MTKIILLILISITVERNGMAIQISELNPLVRINKDTSLEAKAHRHADYMQQQLGLTDAQKAQVYTITLSKVEAMSALNASYHGDRKAAHGDMEKIRTTSDEKLKKVLTPAQLKKWVLALEDKKIKAEEPAKISGYDPTILDSQW